MMDAWEQAALTVERPVVTSQGGASFWRKDDPVMSKDGTQVEMGGMWQAQRTWWGLPNFIKMFVGGYGAGKTLIVCKRAIAVALQNAPAPVAIVSPTFPLARQTVVSTIIALLAGKRTIYGRSFYWRYNQTSHEFYIKFRGRTGLILVYSGENPDALRGPNLGSAYIDEPFIQKREVFEQMHARVRHPDAVIREIGLSGTPEQLNWGYDLCIGKDKDSLDIGVVTAPTIQNKALPLEYEKRLRAILSAKAADAYLEGKFVNLTEGMVYHAFDARDGFNVVDLPMPQFPELGAGMDFNVNPMASAVFWRSGSHIHFIDEIELPNADTEFMCEVLLERYPTLQNVYPDASGGARKTASPGGKSDFFYIERCGLKINCEHKNPLRRDRYNATNGKFRSSQGKTTLTVSPKCHKLIKYLSTYSYELMKQQEQMSHLLDAFSYPIAYLFPVVRESVEVHEILGT